MDAGTVADSLYNRNIASMLVNIPKVGGANLYGYKYDQLNRIMSMDAFTGLTNSTNVFVPVSSTSYKERVSYDPNVNIKTYLRNGNTTRVSMDNMTYTYKPGTNQLDKVVDAATDAAAIDYDKYNDIKQGQANGNYQFDAIGNLISDGSEGITNIVWSVYGKIQGITKASGTISYGYDASGNRISKTAAGKTTWYVRDASGNVMGVYTKEGTANLALSELHLYGSNRLGILNTNIDVQQPVNNNGNSNFIRGNKFFELSNHLGNVLVTVSDKKLQHSTNGTTVDYYEADVVTANDYYPFGMTMPGRKYSAGSLYRYGFNGKENDNNVKGEGNQQDYGMRIYDPRLGRFLSSDPITKSYPMLTPYQFASNRPIDGVDLDGLEYVKRIHTVDASNKVVFTDDIIYYQMDEKTLNAHGGTSKGWYNSAGYGPEGKGVKHEYYFADGKLARDPVWDLPQKNTIGSLAAHGLYSGNGSITKSGAGNDYDFSWQPIDASDAIARRHDINYSKVGAYDVVEDTRTLSADLQMVDEAQAYLKSIPFRLISGQRVSGETVASAKSQKEFIGILADYKQWKKDYMISKGMDPHSKSDNKIVSLNTNYYKLQYITSDKKRIQERIANVAVLLATKSKTK